MWWIMQGPNVSGCRVLQIAVYPVLSMWPLIINGEDDLEEWRPVINNSLTSNWFLTGDDSMSTLCELDPGLDPGIHDMRASCGERALHSVQMSCLPNVI